MNIAILYKTNEYIEHNKVNIREQIDDILDDPANFELREYTNEQSLHEIISNIFKIDNIGITVCNIWETKDTVYAGYFVDYTEEKYLNNNDNINFHYLGSQITLQNVTSHLIIVKMKLSYSISNNNVKTNTTYDSITRTELLDIIEKKFVKDGVVIDIDGKMSTYKYIDNPLEHLILTDDKYHQHYVYHEYEIFTHILIVVVDVREHRGTLNEIGSLLCGSPVNGKIFVGIYRKPDFNENPPYSELSIDRLINILNIRKKGTSLTTGFANSDKEYINFDKLLDIKLREYSNLKDKNISDIHGELLNIAKKKPDS